MQFVVGAGAHGFGGHVMSIDVNNRHFGCRLGVLAAGMSRSASIGGVFGLEGLPTTIDMVGAFRLCARLARPAVKVTVLYIGDVENAASAKEAAFSLIAGGVDVLTGQLNAGQSGLIQAAREKQVFVTGRSCGQNAIAPAQVMTNVIKNWPEMCAAAAIELRDGKLSGATRVYGFDTAGSSGATFGYRPGVAYSDAVPAALRDAIDSVRARHAAHTLTIAPTAAYARAGL